MAQDSVETWRLYSAEASVRLTRERFADIPEARDFLTAVVGSSWWWWNVREQVGVTLVEGGREAGGQVNSWTQPDGDPPTSWTISLHPEQLDSWHLLHEVAHCIAPRWTYGGPTAGDAIPNHAELPFHGRDFAGTRLMLTQQFGDPAEHEALVSAFAHFGVVATPWSDVVAGREATRLTEADLEAARQRSPKGMVLVSALLRRGHNVGPADVGRELMRTRYLFQPPCGPRKASQSWVADQVAQVVPCTARDVSVVERLTEPPATRRHYQVALCMAVLFDVDPVVVEFGLGLAREDDWDVPLERLEVLNPAWVALVRELSDLVQQRPPRWLQGPSTPR